MNTALLLYYELYSGDI